MKDSEMDQLNSALARLKEILRIKTEIGRLPECRLKSSTVIYLTSLLDCEFTPVMPQLASKQVKPQNLKADPNPYGFLDLATKLKLELALQLQGNQGACVCKDTKSLVENFLPHLELFCSSLGKQLLG